MTPKEMYEELEKALREDLDKLKNTWLDDRGRQAVEDTVRIAIHRLIDENDLSTLILLPCGHLGRLEDLDVEGAQDVDTINIIWHCKECEEEA